VARVNEYRHGILEREHAADSWSPGDLASPIQKGARGTATRAALYQTRCNAMRPSFDSINFTTHVATALSAASWTVNPTNGTRGRAVYHSEMRTAIEECTWCQQSVKDFDWHRRRKYVTGDLPATCAAVLTATDADSWSSIYGTYGWECNNYVAYWLDSSHIPYDYSGTHSQEAGAAQYEAHAERDGYSAITSIDVVELAVWARMSGGITGPGVDEHDSARATEVAVRVAFSTPTASYAGYKAAGSEVADYTIPSGTDPDEDVERYWEVNSFTPVEPEDPWWFIGHIKNDSSLDASGSGVCAYAGDDPAWIREHGSIADIGCWAVYDFAKVAA